MKKEVLGTVRIGELALSNDVIEARCNGCQSRQQVTGRFPRLTARYGTRLCALSNHRRQMGMDETKAIRNFSYTGKYSTLFTGPIHPRTKRSTQNFRLYGGKSSHEQVTIWITNLTYDIYDHLSYYSFSIETQTVVSLFKPNHHNHNPNFCRRTKIA